MVKNWASEATLPTGMENGKTTLRNSQIGSGHDTIHCPATYCEDECSRQSYLWQPHKEVTQICGEWTSKVQCVHKSGISVATKYSWHLQWAILEAILLNKNRQIP